MTRVLVQRGSSSSSNAACQPSSSVAQATASSSKEDEQAKESLQEAGELVEYGASLENKIVKKDDVSLESPQRNIDESADVEKSSRDTVSLTRELSGVRLDGGESGGVSTTIGSSRVVSGASYPPLPPVPPSRPSAVSANSRPTARGGSNSGRIGCARRPPMWSVISTRSPPSGSRPTSPRSDGEGEGYNSSDEHSPCYVSSYDDTVDIIVTSVGVNSFTELMVNTLDMPLDELIRSNRMRGRGQTRARGRGWGRGQVGTRGRPIEMVRRGLLGLTPETMKLLFFCMY